MMLHPAFDLRADRVRVARTGRVTVTVAAPVDIPVIAQAWLDSHGASPG